MELKRQKRSQLTLDPEEISRLLLGDEEEQNKAIFLIDKHLRRSVVYGIRKTALSVAPDEIMDIYQEVLLNVLTAAREQRYDPGKPLLSFLYMLAHRRACDRIRKKSTIEENENKLLEEVHRRLENTNVGEVWEQVAKKNDGSRMVKIIRQTVIGMPNRQRQVASVVIDFFPKIPSLDTIRDVIFKDTGELLTVVAIKKHGKKHVTRYVSGWLKLDIRRSNPMKDYNSKRENEALDALMAAAFRMSTSDETTDCEEALNLAEAKPKLSPDDEAAIKSLGSDFVKKLLIKGTQPASTIALKTGDMVARKSIASEVGLIVEGPIRCRGQIWFRVFIGGRTESILADDL
jgi:DNA-directed RNA polymerase specialized sigma24 family protein